MGKTFKDQRKWERKQRDKEEKFKPHTPKKKQKFHEEILPVDDDMDTYEYLDYEYDDEDR